MGRLRWNPFLGEWVIVTPKRATRPFQEEDHMCPFCPNTYTNDSIPEEIAEELREAL
ncbi:MAG: hypothetical protein ACXABV_02900 [Candidatus Thorarchaeota archaeon]|jgi:galactose-1-phosphate uridylyltransferase